MPIMVFSVNGRGILPTISGLVAGGRIDRASVEDDRASSLTYGDKRNQAAFSGFIRHEQDWSSLPVNSYIGLGYVNRFPDYWELFSPKG
ncbi:hypothetical protein VXQ18_06290 [Brucella abortus]|nr:hypothetical protein [Brucella abortus]